MRRRKRQVKKKDGWFFSKSLLDEIYQTPVDTYSSTENGQENENVSLTQTVETDVLNEVSSSIAEKPSIPLVQINVSDEIQLDNLSQVHKEKNHMKEQDKKVFFDSNQEYSYSTKKPKNKDESFSLVEEEGKLVYKKNDDKNSSY